VRRCGAILVEIELDSSELGPATRLIHGDDDAIKPWGAWGDVSRNHCKAESEGLRRDAFNDATAGLGDGCRGVGAGGQ